MGQLDPSECLSVEDISVIVSYGHCIVVARAWVLLLKTKGRLICKPHKLSVLQK